MKRYRLKAEWQGQAVGTIVLMDAEQAAPLLTAGTIEDAPEAVAPVSPVAPVAVQPDVIAAERERITGIMALARTHNLGDVWSNAQVAGGATVATAAQSALTEIAKRNAPVTGLNISVGPDRNLSTLADSLSDAITMRAGGRLVQMGGREDQYRPVRNDAGQLVGRQPHERAATFRNRSLIEMARMWAIAIGVRGADEMSRAQLAEIVTMPKSNLMGWVANPMMVHSTSDFTEILANTVGRTLRLAYEDGPSSWQLWCRRATAPDFKTIYRTQLSEVPDLTQIDEGGKINYVSVSDGQETYALSEYNGGIMLSRRAIINDDLDAFGRIPRLQANAARRKEDDVAYAILTANAALSDGGTLFNATAVTTAGGHANHTTSSGTAMSVTSLGVAFKTMFVQKGTKNAAFLELRPSFLLVPATKEFLARQLISSAVDPATTNNAINPFKESLTVIPSARLEAASPTAWYLAANPNVIDTVEVCFLEGEESPQFGTETDFDTEGVRFKVRHTVAAKAIDFRGLYKNDGA